MTSPDPGAASGRDDQPPVFRLLTLTDGVVAIALTLLVLQLRVPDPSQLAHPDSASDLAAQLSKGSASLISYLISFYTIAQFWMVHREVFRRLTDQEQGLELVNFVFLFTITVMPFSSDVLGEFVGNPLAVDIFALNLMLASLSTSAMIIIARRKGLLISDARERSARIRAGVVPAVMAGSIALSWWSTSAAMYSWILVAAIPAARQRWEAHRQHV